MKRKAGFTLVEIMIVVAIIALLAAIAIPNLLRARLNANESASIAAMQTISTGAQSFRSANPRYPATLDSLANDSPPYIDKVLGNTPYQKSGYVFSLTGTTNSFTATAGPIDLHTSGNRYFFVDESGVVRAATTTATCGSTAIE